MMENDKVWFDERNLTSLKYTTKTNGRFCGTIHNMWSSFYASKRFVYIKYTTNQTLSRVPRAFPSPTNDSFEFEVTFYDKSSASALQMSNSFINANSGVRLNYGLQMGKDLCSRVFEGCVSSPSKTTGRLKSSTNESTLPSACMITSPGYPGVYAKNSKCQYFIRGSNSNENVQRGNDKLLLVNDNIQLDATVCHFEPSNKYVYRGFQVFFI